MFKKIKRVLLVVLTFGLLYGLTGACCSAQYNIAGRSNPPSPKPVVEDDQTLMYTCFSGGGTRAMAMGYEVVDALAKVDYKVYVRGPSLFDTTTLREEIDYTSGVSGGSFVSAALAVYPQEEWPIFYRKGVSRDIQGSIIKHLLAVKNWPRLLSPYYNRTDLASEFYDHRVFKNYTFGDLPQRPVVYINTTVLAARSHFVFTDEYFRYIGSDIYKYPVGFACAASSAFPVGFAPMTLRNYIRTYQSEDSLRLNAHYRYAVANEQADIQQHAWADLYRFLRDTSNQWLHVSDGGIAGNTGIERVLDAWRSNGIINRALNDVKNPLKRLIFVVVNAGAGVPDGSCSKRMAPNAFKVLMYTTTTSMDLMSATRIAELKARVDELWTIIQQSRTFDASLANLEKPYLIEISARNLPEGVLKQAFNNIPTTFDLPAEQLLTIRQAVAELMTNNTEYQRLLQSIAAERK